ncbi:MAG: tetratricopeptide repeat protein [Verrucomicrobia bacterium]|nr:tetratricopeptide repeat protein [Verrucomicrobiota bacterium]
MKKSPLLALLFSLALIAPIGSHASYTFKNGKLIKSEEVATMSVQEHYGAAMDAYQKQNWDEVIRHSVIVIKNFASTPFATESYFYLGAAYFHTGEYEFSNRFLTKYLKKQATPKFFEEAIQLKFKIAERYQKGAKKHILGMENMPKWVPARDEAIAIYDEVITALPHHELAAQALFGKAKLLLKDDEYKSSIETYQTLIRRFPKHPLAAESYIGVGEVYLVQAQKEYPDQDFLDLAEINLRKFHHDFPGEEKLTIADKMLMDMKEVYASDLYDTGRFYERTNKPQAAYIYYTRILAKYPSTKVCEFASKRLGRMDFKPSETVVPAKVVPDAAPKVEEQKSPLLNLQVQGLTVDAEEPQNPVQDSALESLHEDVK